MLSGQFFLSKSDAKLKEFTSKSKLLLNVFFFHPIVQQT